MGIEGWVGYAGNRIIGLNPSRLYCLVEKAARPPVVISALPDNFAIDRTVVRDSFWTVHIDGVESLKTIPAPDASPPNPKQHIYRVCIRATKDVKFVGVEKATAQGHGQYELHVKLPGSFGVYWSEPQSMTAGTTLLGKLPSKATLQRISNGLLCQRSSDARITAEEIVHDPGAAMEAEGTVDWLLTLPKEPLRCAFHYGAEHGYGDGANYMVRINGKTLWKRYFNETADDPKDAQAHKPRSAIADTIDLSAYAGQTIVLELATNGHYSAGSDIMRWRTPRLEPNR